MLDLTEKYDRTEYVKGRGTILIVDIPDEPVRRGDVVLVKGKKYHVYGVEGFINNFGEFRGPIGLVVRELEGDHAVTG